MLRTKGYKILRYLNSKGDEMFNLQDDENQGPLSIPGDKSNVLEFVVGGLVSLAVFVGLKFMPFEVRARIYVGITIGVLAGLVPFFVARKRGYDSQGTLFLVICANAGALLGLVLAAPLSAVFTVIALRRKPRS